MEREKMIEEIARIICENEKPCYACLKCTIYDGKICCKYLRIAEKIVNSLIPDGAVVLSPEERDEEMKEYNRDRAERDKLFNELDDERYNVFSRMETLYKVKCAEVKAIKSQNKILKKNADEAFQQGLNESRGLYKEEVKDEVRKETAREILSDISKAIKVKEDIYGREYHIIYEEEIFKLKKKLKEKYGVEVKE